jgi:ABC-2 type transport system ATP-binding protein
MAFAIETEGVSYRAGRGFAIRDLTLRIGVGEVCGFLGPNGAGKTTIIRILLGLLRAERGRIRILGRPFPEEAPAVLAEVGYVPERPHFDATLTVGQILRFQAAFYPSWDAGFAVELVRRLEVDPAQQFGRLSKGQKAKVMILAALAQRPRLLLLDEPTDGLDPVVRREILDILLAEIRERSVSVLVSSHLVHELQGLCTRIAIVDAGALVATSTLEQLGASGSGAGPLALEDAYVRTLREARLAGRGAA